MFCKNCGNQISDVADFCTNCGVAKGKGTNFCSTCGNPINPNAAVCLSCGCSTETKKVGTKSKLAAGLLAIFVGSLGVHSFYLGYTKKGIIQLVLSVILSWTVVAPIAVEVWAIIDAVNILTGKMPDSEGNSLQD